MSTSLVRLCRMSAWPLVLAPTTFTMFGWDNSLVTRTSCKISCTALPKFGTSTARHSCTLREIWLWNVSTELTVQLWTDQTHLQSNILVLYGMTEDSLESKFLPRLTVFHKVDGAEATLRNLTHHLVPDNSSWSSRGQKDKLKQWSVGYDWSRPPSLHSDCAAKATQGAPHPCKLFHHQLGQHQGHHIPWDSHLKDSKSKSFGTMKAL